MYLPGIAGPENLVCLGRKHPLLCQQLLQQEIVKVTKGKKIGEFSMIIGDAWLDCCYPKPTSN